MVELVGAGVSDGGAEAVVVEEVAGVELDLPAQVLAGAEGPVWRTAEPGDAVAAVEEDLGQEGAVLAGDAGDEGAARRRGGSAGRRGRALAAVVGYDGPPPLSSSRSASTISLMSSSKLVRGSQPRSRLALARSPMR